MHITTMQLILCILSYTVYNVYLLHTFKALCNDTKWRVENFFFPDEFPEKKVEYAIRIINQAVCISWVVLKMVAESVSIPSTVQSSFWLVSLFLTVLAFAVYIISYLGSVSTYEVVQDNQDKIRKKLKENPFQINGELALLHIQMHRFDMYIRLQYVTGCFCFSFLSTATWTFQLIH